MMKRFASDLGSNPSPRDILLLICAIEVVVLRRGWRVTRACRVSQLYGSIGLVHEQRPSDDEGGLGDNYRDVFKL